VTEADGIEVEQRLMRVFSTVPCSTATKLLCTYPMCERALNCTRTVVFTKVLTYVRSCAGPISHGLWASRARSFWINPQCVWRLSMPWLSCAMRATEDARTTRQTRTLRVAARNTGNTQVRRWAQTEHRNICILHEFTCTYTYENVHIYTYVYIYMCVYIYT